MFACRHVDITLAWNSFGFDDSYLFRRLELHLRDEEDEEARENAPVPGVQFGHLEKAGGRLVVKRGLFTLEYIDMPGASGLTTRKPLSFSMFISNGVASVVIVAALVYAVTAWVCPTKRHKKTVRFEEG